MKKNTLVLNSLVFFNIFQQILLGSSSGDKKIRKSNACESFLNNKTINQSTSTQWECQIISTQKRQSKKSFKHNNGSETKNIKTRLVCTCSLRETCIDHEEFHLESDLVDSQKYVNLKYALGENFYTKQCSEGLKGLTGEKDKWKCELHMNEYYCSCKRETVCKKNKVIKILI